MWYPCSCPDCNAIEANNLNNSPWVNQDMGSIPHAIHGYLPIANGPMTNMGYPGTHTMNLHRSATFGYMPKNHFYPIEDHVHHQHTFDQQQQQHLINGRLAITDGKVKEIVEDDVDILKASLQIHDGNSMGLMGSKEAPDDVNLADEGLKKAKDYSDDSLTPDSTLPAVIRRRNRNRRKQLATSMVEGTPGTVPWEEAPKPAARTRSQSVSDDQWAQMMAAQAAVANTDGVIGPSCPPGHTPADMSAFAGATTRRNYNTMTGSGARSGSSFGRGMVSSASVCDLNSLAQQQTQHGFNNSHAANSFQQLNMMGYNNGMMWGAPCDLCQGGAPMYPGHPNASGMKRTASNLSMNLSSVGSDVPGYPWGPPPPPHVHHHMPPMYPGYPGYYPGYHPHMAPPPMGSGMGLNMSIPDSMHTFGKVPSSPAPSVRSTSHRSHKSTKSRSFSAADNSGRSSRARKLKRSEESEESRSSSVSDDDEIDNRENKSGRTSSSIAWQCDHCTFINSGGARTCGMCSKTVGNSGHSNRRGSERRRSDRRRDRRTDHEDDDRDLSDYDNDDGVVKSNLSFNIKDSKRESRTKVSGSSKNKSKKKSRRRGSSGSESESGSEGGADDERLERHMRDLRLSSSSSRRRGSDYDGINNKDKDRERERSSRKKEGKLRWKD